MKIKAKIKSQKTIILHGYAFLFCLTIIAINPFATSRGAIWTQPKIVCVAFLVVLHSFIFWITRKNIELTKQWQKQATCWAIFLAVSLISTVYSPFSERAFFGHDITADGWLYWLLLAGFTLTNSLVLQRYPYLFRWQLRGFLVGATLVAFSIYPQLLNWKIDYT